MGWGEQATATAQGPTVPARSAVDSAIEEAMRPTLVEQANNLAVVDERTLGVATEILTQLQGALSRMDGARVTLVKPLNDHVKMINAIFKERRAPGEAALAMLKNRVKIFHQTREAEAARLQAEQMQRREAEDQAREALELDETPVTPEVAIEAPRTVAHTTGGSAQVKKRWDYEITDFDALVRAVAEAHIPLDWLEPNRGEIRSWLNQTIRNGHTPANMPGVRFYQESDVAVRRNSDA